MSIQATERMFAILEALATEPDGLRLTEIGRRAGLHKSTASRFLAAMEHRGYVEKVQDRAVYRLGLHFVELASVYLNKVELKTEAQPFLQQLAARTTHAVYLAIPDGAEIVYIDKVDTFQSIRKYSIIGRRAPVHCTALGKSLLASLADPDVAALLHGRVLKAYTPNTITDLARLQRELDDVRRRGWVEDDQEYEPGVRCIAAPIYDYRSEAIAAVSTSGPVAMLGKKEVKRLAAYVMEAAAGISRRMGYPAGNRSTAPGSGARSAARAGQAMDHAASEGTGHRDAGTRVPPRSRRARMPGRQQPTLDRRRRHADPS